MLALYNANIYTFNNSRPSASAILIDRGQILALGSDQEILSEIDYAQSVFDVEGRTILPGLMDSHIHLEQFAMGLQKIDCETDTRPECVDRIAERAAHTDPGKWILGHGWNQNVWPEGFGSKEVLDEIAPIHPVYLTAKSLHAAWVNSVALRQANITRDTTAPPGGRIDRDEDGHPTGILFETAMDLVADKIPEPSVDQVADAIYSTLPILWEFGLTGVHDFDRRRCFSALQIIRERGDLKLRILKNLPLEDMPHAVALGLRSGYGDDFLRIGGIKAFADGALGPRTAAMLQTYTGEQHNKGILLLDKEEIFEQGRIAVENGLSMTIHAIGDRANHEVLDGYEKLRAYEQNLGTSLRHRIEHVQLIHPDDAHRLAELNLIASMQPIHATSDMLMADQYWGDRAELSYAWRTQLSHGAVLTFGSDAPVETPDPFRGIYAAISRRREDGYPNQKGWYPNERLSITQALNAYTRGPAFTAGMENKLGKLESGYKADLIILDTNPFTCQPDEIPGIKPSGTIIDGIWVIKNI
jgi:predicted amidohydrolase YtcJ